VDEVEMGERDPESPAMLLSLEERNWEGGVVWMMCTTPRQPSPCVGFPAWVGQNLVGANKTES